MFQNGLQNLLHDQPSTVTVDLRRILRRIAVGLAHQHDQHLVKHLIAVHSHTVMHRIARLFAHNFLFIFRTKYFLKHCKGLRAADTDDSDPGAAHGCRSGCNGICMIHRLSNSV